jgi:hypothetical protein
MPSVKLRSVNPWLAVAVWVGLIYASIPIVRNLREKLVEIIPARAIGYTVMAVVVVVVVAALAHLRRSRARVGGSDVAWLTGVSVVVLFWTSRLMGAPEEAVHFLEYGGLGVLLYRAWDNHVSDWTVFIAATLAGALVGTVDEIIQWLVPNRYFDFRDIFLNLGAVALAQVVVWRMTTRPTAPVSRPSLRILCRLAAALVLLLTFCLAATPQRLIRVAELLPMPGRIASGADAICEYGYRHAVDRRTSFRSRLAREQLAHQDRIRAVEVAGVLEATRGTESLSHPVVSPLEDPFGYEIRIHLFSRNRNFNRARDTTPGSPDHRRFMTAAWRENLILERFFGQTLELSAYAWRARRKTEVEAAQDPDEVFVSRVGAHLITRVREGRLRALMLALFTTLVACDLLLATRSRQEAPLG